MCGNILKRHTTGEINLGCFPNTLKNGLVVPYQCHKKLFGRKLFFVTFPSINVSTMMRLLLIKGSATWLPSP